MELRFGYKQTSTYAIKAGNVYTRSHGLEVYEEQEVIRNIRSWCGLICFLERLRQD